MSHGQGAGEGREDADEHAWREIVDRLRADGLASAPEALEDHVDDPAAPLPGDFVPPTPAPLLSGRPGLVLASAALVVPLLVLLGAALLSIRLPGLLSTALVLIVAVGATALFLALPRRGEGGDDRMDRGARV